jgi:hypothetical protein
VKVKHMVLWCVKGRKLEVAEDEWIVLGAIESLGTTGSIYIVGRVDERTSVVTKGV